MGLLELTVKVIIGLIALFIVTKFLGKTKLSQITPFDFIFGIVLGELMVRAVYDGRSVTDILYPVLLWGFLIQLLFGISGIPVGDQSPKRNYRSGIAYLKAAGLDAMELPFVRNVNVTDKNKDEILHEKIDMNFYLSAHGSYFINLNADEVEKQQQSLERIIKGAKALKSVDGRSLVFHPGFYLNDSPEATYATIKENLMKLPDLGVAYRLETTGKPTQFGSLDELIALCAEVPALR